MEVLQIRSSNLSIDTPAAAALRATDISRITKINQLWEVAVVIVDIENIHINFDQAPFLDN